MWDDELKAFIIVVLIEVLAMIGFVRLGTEARLPGALAQIEQLREDTDKVGVGENEDVIGQVVKWNQKIKSNQRYRQIWWGRLTVPKGWEEVEIIEIPTR